MDSDASRTNFVLVSNAQATLATLATLGEDLWVLPWVQGYQNKTEEPALDLKLSSRVYVYREREEGIIEIAEIYSIKKEHRRINWIGRKYLCYTNFPYGKKAFSDSH